MNGSQGARRKYVRLHNLVRLLGTSFKSLLGSVTSDAGRRGTQRRPCPPPAARAPPLPTGAEHHAVLRLPAWSVRDGKNTWAWAWAIGYWVNPRQPCRLPLTVGWMIPGGKGGARRAGDTDGIIHPAGSGVQVSALTAARTNPSEQWSTRMQDYARAKVVSPKPRCSISRAALERDTGISTGVEPIMRRVMRPSSRTISSTWLRLTI